MVLISILLVVLFFIAFYFVSVYNQLVKSKVLVQEGWSGIGTFLQQRNDVIPNMVEIVKGYAGHENNTLIEVTKWRNKSAMAITPGEQNDANAGLNKAMLDFYSVSEQYPDLKANTNFLKLQEDLASLEEKINQSRRYYNGTVREFNQNIAVFPKLIVASMFNFEAQEFFLEDESAKIAPKIAF
jgi:LemA protein